MSGQKKMTKRIFRAGGRAGLLSVELDTLQYDIYEPKG